MARSIALFGELPIVVYLSFCGWNIPDWFQQPVVVKPGHPFQRGQLHGLLGFPGSPFGDQFGLV